jgi:hypothetical protein
MDYLTKIHLKQAIIKVLEDYPDGSSSFCVISLTYIGSLNLCVLCVFVVRSTPSPKGLYLRTHFTHQIQESLQIPTTHFPRY